MQDPPHHDAWDATLYAEHSAHHREHDKWFLSSFTLAPTARVLDLGCGTGEFTNRIADLVPQGRVLGVDGSPSQIERAQAIRRNHVELRLGRLEHLDDFLGDETFDAVISRATLHWLPREEHPGLLRAIVAHLRPRGLFRAEFGGRGQMQAALAVLDQISERFGGPRSPWFFPDAEEYRELVVEAGLDPGAGFVQLSPQRRKMPTFEALVGFLRSQAFVGYETRLSAEAESLFREEAEARARVELRRPDGSYDLDFVRLDLLAWRAQR
jgi:trans-aconitate 2-methyltransferase